MKKLSTGPSRTHARGLYVNGNTSILEAPLRPRAYACTWREACKATDYVLEHFGNPIRDRGIWVWYCQCLGLETFLDLADEADKKHLVPTLLKIAKNGDNREKSLAKLPRATYFRHRDMLLDFFK